MKIYKFSPINNSEQIDEVLSYITVELEKLSQLLLGEKLFITTLKIFSHYQEEYTYLFSKISEMGTPSSFNSKTSFYSKVSREIKGYPISYLGVRIVDPYRLHVGCGDYEVSNFEEIRQKYIGTSPYIRDFNSEMIELWHPNFDVLGYIVPKL